MSHALAPLRDAERGRNLSDTIKTIQGYMKEAGFEACLVLSGSTVLELPDSDVDLDLFARWDDLNDVAPDGAISPAESGEKLEQLLSHYLPNFKHEKITPFHDFLLFGLAVKERIVFNEFFKYGKVYIIYPDSCFIVNKAIGLERFSLFVSGDDAVIFSAWDCAQPITASHFFPAAGCL